jgi:hypothetical protein
VTRGGARADNDHASLPLSSTSIEVPTTPVENFPQAVVVLPIEVPTTPVDNFAQTDELLSIEVSTTVVETFSQTVEVLPIAARRSHNSSMNEIAS